MKKITVIVVILVVVGVLAWFYAGGTTGQQVSKLDAIDTVGEYYGQWLKAKQEPAADPDQTTLAKSPILSPSLRTRLVDEQKKPVIIDPVLCQTKTPEDIAIRSISATPDKVRALVTSKDKKVTEQAVVTLNKLNEGWYIDNIECSPGEFEPEREFSFEHTGSLLKNSLPKPYNTQNWHLVFEENGEAGHVVPLFFDKDSQCTNLDGSKAVCDPTKFTEATKVSVHAQMSERGATVKKLEFVK